MNGHSAPALSDSVLRTFWRTELFCCTVAREGRQLRVLVAAAGRPLFSRLCENGKAAARCAESLLDIFRGPERELDRR
jgi:hypothetical protein